ncbi:MAG: hypothetical protein HOP22_12750 [Nitrospiraceae bacterium]|nr:hypothetical protein [Nitrospiraceae bacterium]
MKFDSRTESLGLRAAGAGNRCNWTRVLSLSLVVAGSLLLQGCLAGAWVALVAVDTMRNSNGTVGSFEESWVGQVAVNAETSGHVSFGQFEKSWVAKRDQSGDAVFNSKVTSVAVLPVEGDPEMGVRLATLLQQETALRVESLPTASAEGTVADFRSGNADDADRSILAKEVTRDLGVDTILVSRIAESSSHPSDWGRKAEGSRRLYLYLLNREGHLLWKDELPFVLAKGSTPSQNTYVQTDFTHHVMQHVKVLHLDELGYLPNKEKRRKVNRPSATLTPIE